MTLGPWFAAVTLTAADGLSFGAAPAFAVMAVFAALDAPHDALCSVVARPMSGMVWMYALMSVRHTSPWLKLLSGRR